MAKTRYAPDRGLIARMGLTMFLLGIVFVAFVLALYFVVEIYMEWHGSYFRKASAAASPP